MTDIQPSDPEILSLRNRMQRRDHELHLIFDHLTRWLVDKSEGDADMGDDTFEDIDPEIDMIRGMVSDCIDI